MIHVATVHWGQDHWIDLQINALKRYSSEPYRTYAFLNNLSERSVARYSGKFDYVSCEDIKSHAIKLNLLADIISFAAMDEDDLLVFLDGDAFPIDDYAVFARKHLPESRLIAVRRDENNGDSQPHPCFCVTTVGFWREINGDWKKGYRWENNQGKLVTDVGGNMLGLLKESNINWMPLRRSNHKNLHPLFFGIYGNLVYHHGAGFRVPSTRIINTQLKQEAMRHISGKILEPFPNWWIFRKLKDRYHPYRRLRDKEFNQMSRLSSEVFELIRANPDWYRTLL